MATKKPTFKKQTPVNPSETNPIKTTKVLWVVIALAVALLLLAFAYNKYLDYRNVEDMKTLLADFQQLEKIMEEQTGEEFTIETDCSSVGKFATSYACSIHIEPSSGIVTEEMTRLFDNAVLSYGTTGCGRYSKIGYEVNLSEDYFSCRALKIRGSNEIKSELIFYDYDESPGSPY